MINIRPATFPDDLATVRELLLDYADGVGVDLCFQGFEDELSGLPGKYHPPGGRFLVAVRDEHMLGCVAMRRIDDTSCEMKRLFVRPPARGEHLGRRLVKQICGEAARAGYVRICLDTLPSMAAAQQLYRSLGFEEIDAYVFNPVAGTKFMGLVLTADHRQQPD